MRRPIHQISNDVDNSNYRRPYDQYQQWENKPYSPLQIATHEKCDVAFKSVAIETCFWTIYSSVEAEGMNVLNLLGFV